MKKTTVLCEKMFKTAVTTAMVTSAITAVAPAVTQANSDMGAFNDVKKSSDYYEYVNELFERGFVNGYNDGSFNPNGLLTRAHSAKILALNLGLDVTKDFNSTFIDFSNDHWAYPYMAALKEAGIMDGYPDGTFKPNEPITRNQMAKIIVRGYKLEPASTIALPFTDAQADHWATPYIQTLFDLGITIGQTPTTYGGSSKITRANMAAFTIRSEETVDYRENRKPDEDVISSIDENKLMIGNQTYYIAKELQPLLHTRNLAVLNAANLDFIKIGTKIVGIRNIELLNDGTAENPLILDLAGGTVDVNITVAGDYIKLADANIIGDITIKKGDQHHIELNGLDLNGRLIVEGESKREQESIIKLTNTTVNELVVNRDETKIITDKATSKVQVGDNVSKIEIEGKIEQINFNGNQDVLLKGTLQTDSLVIETPIKVTLENKAQLPSVETQQYGSQLITPIDSSIDKLIKPDNIAVEEAVKVPTGGSPSVGNVTDTSEVVRPTTPNPTPDPSVPNTTPTPPWTGGESSNLFVPQTVTANNSVDANQQDPLAVGMVGTAVTTSDEKVATAQLVDGKIVITSTGFGTAVITVKEDAPSEKEAQITVTVDANGNMTHKIKRPSLFTSQKLTTNNNLDAIGMVGTAVTTSDEKVATAQLVDGKIVITSTGIGTAIITVKEDAPSEKEAQITVTVDANGNMTHKIKRPSLFTSQKLTTNNNLDAVGMVGTAVTTSDEKVATAQLVDGKIVITSTGIGTAVITVKEDAPSEKEAQITVTVDANGNMTHSIQRPVTPPPSPGISNPFVSKTLTTNNNLDAIGMVGTAVTTSDAKVATAQLVDGKIVITSTGVGTAIITVKEDAPSEKEAQITVTVASDGSMKQTIKRPSAFVSQTITANNSVDANQQDPLAVGMVGTAVTTSDAKVATAQLVDGKIVITSTGIGTAIITVKEDAPSEKEAQITVTVASDGSMKQTIKRPSAFVSQTITANNSVDANQQDPLAVGMVGTAVTTSDAKVATAQLVDGKIVITSTGIGTAIITVKEDAPSEKEAQITVTVASDGSMKQTIKRPSAFVSQTITANNSVDANQQDPLAVGMVGTTVTTSDAKVATAQLVDGKIVITSTGVGTAVITVKEDAPSEKEAQITVTVDANGSMTHKIKRPLEVALEKINSNPTPAIADLVKLYEVADMKGVTPSNAVDVTAAVKKAIADKGAVLTAEELALAIDLALLPEQIKKDNPDMQKVSTQLDLKTTGLNGTAFTWQAVTAVDGATVDHRTGDVTRSSNDDTNDVVALRVTATNGTATKDAAIDATIKESKAPTVTSARLQDINSDGDVSNGDSIELTFSEPVNSIGKLTVGSHVIDPPTGTWSSDKTKLTITMSDSVSSSGTLTIRVEDIVDLQDNRTSENEIPLSTVDPTIEAQEAVEKAEKAKTLTDFDAAQGLVTALPAMEKKDALQKRLDDLWAEMKATAINKIEAIEKDVSYPGYETQVKGNTITLDDLKIAVSDRNLVNDIKHFTAGKPRSVSLSGYWNAIAFHEVGELKTEAQITKLVEEVNKLVDVVMEWTEVYQSTKYIFEAQGEVGEEVLPNFDTSAFGGRYSFKGVTSSKLQYYAPPGIIKSEGFADDVRYRVTQADTNYYLQAHLGVNVTISTPDPAAAAALAKINAGTATAEDYTNAGLTLPAENELATMQGLVAESKAKKGSDLTFEDAQTLLDNYKLLRDNYYALNIGYNLVDGAESITFDLSISSSSGLDRGIYYRKIGNAEKYFVNWTDGAGNPINEFTIAANATEVATLYINYVVGTNHLEVKRVDTVKLNPSGGNKITRTPAYSITP